MAKDMEMNVKLGGKILPGFLSAFKSAKKQTEELKQESKSLSNELKDVSAYERQSKALKRVASAIEENKKKQAELSAKIKETSKPSKALISSYEKQLKQLDALIEMQDKHTQSLKSNALAGKLAAKSEQEIAKMREETLRKLEAANKRALDIEARGARLARITRGIEVTREAANKYIKSPIANTAAGMGVAAGTVGAAIYGGKKLAQLPFDVRSQLMPFADMFLENDDLENEIRKFSKGSKEEQSALIATLKELSRKTGTEFKDLAKATIGGLKANLTGDALLEYVEFSNKLVPATGLSGEEVGDALGAIMVAGKRTVKQSAEFADMINYLSDALANVDIKEAFEVAKRADAQLTNMDDATKSAFIATGLQSGLGAELTATGLVTLGNRFSKDAAYSKAQRDMYKKMGISTKVLQKLWHEDPIAALEYYGVGLNSLPEHLRTEAMTITIGDEGTKFGSKLIGSTSELRKAQALARSNEAAGSVDREFQFKQSTKRAEMDRQNRRLDESFAKLGESAYDAIILLSPHLEEMINNLSSALKDNPTLLKDIVDTIDSVGKTGFKLLEIIGRAITWLARKAGANVWTFGEYEEARKERDEILVQDAIDKQTYDNLLARYNGSESEFVKRSTSESEKRLYHDIKTRRRNNKFRLEELESNVKLGEEYDPSFDEMYRSKHSGKTLEKYDENMDNIHKITKELESNPNMPWWKKGTLIALRDQMNTESKFIESDSLHGKDIKNRSLKAGEKFKEGLKSFGGFIPGQPIALSGNIQQTITVNVNATGDATNIANQTAKAVTQAGKDVGKRQSIGGNNASN